MSNIKQPSHHQGLLNLTPLLTFGCCLQRSKEIVKISLGAQAINELLGGGLESKCITEIYGEFRYMLHMRALTAPIFEAFEFCMNSWVNAR